MLSLALPFITSKSKRQTGRSFYRISIDQALRERSMMLFLLAAYLCHSILLLIVVQHIGLLIVYHSCILSPPTSLSLTCQDMCLFLFQSASGSFQFDGTGIMECLRTEHSVNYQQKKASKVVTIETPVKSSKIETRNSDLLIGLPFGI